MEDNTEPLDSSANRGIKWQRSSSDFVEFVMLLTDFSICINQKQNVPKHEFNSLCDSLGDSLAPLFNVSTSPYLTFAELRQNTFLTYEFTRKVIEQLNCLKEDDEFYALLEAKGITPSYEYMTEEIIKWREVEKFATLLWLYLNTDQ